MPYVANDSSILGVVAVVPLFEQPGLGGLRDGE